MDDLRPQAIPEPILSQPQAINLYTIAIWALASIAILVVVGAIILAWFNRTVPESVIVLGSVAVGALAGMVATSERTA